MELFYLQMEVKCAKANAAELQHSISLQALERIKMCFWCDMNRPKMHRELLFFSYGVNRETFWEQYQDTWQDETPTTVPQTVVPLFPLRSHPADWCCAKSAVEQSVSKLHGERCE